MVKNSRLRCQKPPDVWGIGSLPEGLSGGVEKTILMHTVKTLSYR